MNSLPSFDVPARLTHAEAMAVLGGLTRAVSGGVRSIDLSALTEFDSSALSVLLAARRVCADAGAIRFLNVPDKLRRLANLYGVEALVFDAV